MILDSETQIPEEEIAVQILDEEKSARFSSRLLRPESQSTSSGAGFFEGISSETEPQLSTVVALRCADPGPHPRSAHRIFLATSFLVAVAPRLA